jgi:hypothetical protein
LQLSRFCPSDTYLITKRGSAIRVDTTLMPAEGGVMPWKRGDVTFFFSFGNDDDNGGGGGDDENDDGSGSGGVKAPKVTCWMADNEDETGVCRDKQIVE